jgi:hypothetical protein
MRSCWQYRCYKSTLRTIGVNLILYVTRYQTQSIIYAQQIFSSSRSKTRAQTSDEHELHLSPFSSVISSFNNSGGKDGRDICNIFNFDEDNDVVGRLGCLFLQESSRFLCFPFLWHFFKGITIPVPPEFLEPP